MPPGAVYGRGKVPGRDESLPYRTEIRAEIRGHFMNKFEVRSMDLYYGSFHALKNINIDIPEKEITAFIGK